MALINALKLFSLRDEGGKGRAALMFSAVSDMLILQLTGGIFYTGFLVGYDFDIVNIGVLTFIPFLANIFGVPLTPLVLRRFKKRKAVITIARTSYYLINILGITLLPMFVTGSAARLGWMAAIIFVSNLVNTISVAGYNAWYINYLPEHVRADYFSISQFLSYFIPGILILVSGALADSLTGSPHQMIIIIALRYVALAVGLLNVIVLALPKEQPYSETETARITEILTTPLRNRPFMLTMLMVFIWQFSLNAYSSLFTVYLLNDIGVSYLFYNIIIATYSLFFIFFSGFWKRWISRTSWFGVYGVTMLINIPAQFALAFVSPSNYVPLMLATRYTQHFIGIGQNVSYANFQYIFIPEGDRITYTSFYQLTLNAGNFAGLAFGTAFLALLPDFSMNIFGITLGGVPFLVMVNAAASAVLAPLSFWMARRYETRERAASE
ncbi:MAG: MFS transporter [Eubacteriales bacterium]|jgi:Na+/melibiose symporter-like transporter